MSCRRYVLFFGAVLFSCALLGFDWVCRGDVLGGGVGALDVLAWRP